MTEQTATEQTETETVVVPDLSEVGEIGRAIISTLQAQVAEYATLLASVERATGDASKAAHDLIESSDDAKVVKFREWREKSDAAREKAVADISAYVRSTLLAGETLSEEEVTAAQGTLKEIGKEFEANRKFYLGQGSIAKVPGHENLLPSLPGKRKSVSKSAGTGNGGVKPRITGIYVDGTLCSHEVVKDGKTENKSSFTDAVKFLSETHGVKVNTSDLHTGYFATAGVEPANWSDAPDSVEYVVHVTDKDGASHNHTVLVTK